MALVIAQGSCVVGALAISCTAASVMMPSPDANSSGALELGAQARDVARRPAWPAAAPPRARSARPRRPPRPLPTPWRRRRPAGAASQSTTVAVLLEQLDRLERCGSAVRRPRTRARLGRGARAGTASSASSSASPARLLPPSCPSCRPCLRGGRRRLVVRRLEDRHQLLGLGDDDDAPRRHHRQRPRQLEHVQNCLRASSRRSARKQLVDVERPEDPPRRSRRAA